MVIHLGDGESLLDRPLRRSRRRMICGVCGGLAEWLGWDVTLVRVLFVLFSILASPLVGILTYVVLVLVVPEEDRPRHRRRRAHDDLDPL